MRPAIKEFAMKVETRQISSHVDLTISLVIIQMELMNSVNLEYELTLQQWLIKEYMEYRQRR